ncbi:hypothetical protein OROHE_008403 [Orobanche hederae]
MESALVIYEAPNKHRRNEKHNNPQLDDDFVESGHEAPKRKKPATRNVFTNLLFYYATLDKENDKAKAKGKGKAPMFNNEDISEKREYGDINVNAGTEEDAEDESFPSLPSRCNLITFTKTLSKLNEKQVSAIDEMGFQAVRDLNINTIPSRLAYWVVDNFNHNSSELLLTRNRRILVTEDDVTRVYGFPKWKRFVQRFQKKDESQLFDEMMDYIPDTQRHKITIKKLHEAALCCIDGGAWFKRLFMVAIQATFMESTANGYVSPFILNCLSDVNRIKDWNWSEYVMRSLIENKTAYAEENASHFVGPLLFLMLFYVDRVRYKVQKTLREFPVIANWTTKLLRSREKAEIKGGCFGDGLPQEPIQIDIAPVTHDNKVDYTSIPKTSGVPAPAVEAGAGVNIEVLRTAKKITELAVHMMKLIETAPEDVVNTPSFHRTIDKAMQSISCSTVLSTHTDSHATESTQELDDFCNHPDVVKLLNDVDEQLKKRDEQLVRLEEMSSFSLGLTQMWNSSPNEDFGIGGSSKGKHMQEGKDDEARNVIVDVRTNTPAPADVAENVVANENDDLRNAGDTTAGFTIDGAENTTEETIRRCNTPARTKANYHASRLPQYATEVPQPQILPADTITNIKKRRAKNALNKPLAFRSPFLVRQINPVKRLMKNEIKCGIYALQHSPETEETIVFANGEVEVTRDHMYTLAKNQTVGVGVVDAWCLMLNHLESSRGAGSPARFFANTFLCTDALLSKDLTQEERKDSFFENITPELNSNKHLELREIDFVFPVYRENKYFAVCVCLRNSKIVVLDSLNDDATEYHAPKYGDILPNLRAILAEYLFYRGLVTKAKLLEKSTLEISAIKWGDRHNLVDSGVYLMRHMETFMGDILTKWSCGLSSKCDKQLILLRIRYCAALINWSNNIVKDYILENADTHFRKVCADPNFKPETLLLG